jgi:hypothetical protein
MMSRTKLLQDQTRLSIALNLARGSSLTFAMASMSSSGGSES